MATIYYDASEPYSEDTHVIVKLYETDVAEDPPFVRRLFEAAEDVRFVDTTGKPFKMFSCKKMKEMLHPIIVINNCYGKPIRLAIPHEHASMFWLRWG